MPAEVLVMCGQCGRPQPAGPRCIACGAELPPALTSSSEGSTSEGSTSEGSTSEGSTSEGSISEGSTSPVVEAELGEGRRLSLLQSGRLEWRPRTGAPALGWELAQLASFALRARPVYEALVFLVPTVLSFWLRFWVRVPGLALGVAALVACFGLRRFAFTLTTKDGRRQELMLGISRPGGPLAVRFRALYETLAPELRRAGVRTLDEVAK